MLVDPSVPGAFWDLLAPPASDSMPSGMSSHQEYVRINSEGSRNGLLAKWFFGGLGYPGQQTTLFFKKRLLLALPPAAAKPNNQSFLEKVWFVGLGTPGLQTNVWPKKHYGIHLNQLYMGHGAFDKGHLGRKCKARARQLVVFGEI